MAYAPHWLYAFGGTLNTAQSPAEIWQCGVRVALTGSSSGDSIDEDQALGDWHDPMKTWMQPTAGGITPWAPTTCTLDWLKINKIDAQGHYADDTTHVYDYSPHVTGSVPPLHQDIIAVAVTWRTGKTRPPGAWGRVFLPGYGIASSSPGNMRMDTATTKSIANVGGQLLATIATTLGAQDLEGSPVVASKVDGSLRNIREVTCGDVFDVQRRRKNALHETYQVATNWTD